MCKLKSIIFLIKFNGSFKFLSNSYLKFWGTRGSNPSPDSDKMKYGGDTSCVEIMIKNKLYPLYSS